MDFHRYVEALECGFQPLDANKELYPAPAFLLAYFSAQKWFDNIGEYVST